jgi:hypothetical protein
MLTDYVDAKAKELGCTMIVLTLTGNYTAHRFITIKDTYLKDFILKILNEEGLS